MPVKELDAASTASSSVLTSNDTNLGKTIASTSEKPGWGSYFASLAFRYLPQSIQERVQQQTTITGLAKGIAFAAIPAFAAYLFGQGSNKVEVESATLKGDAVVFRNNIGEVKDPSTLPPQPKQTLSAKTYIGEGKSAMFETNIGSGSNSR